MACRVISLLICGLFVLFFQADDAKAGAPGCGFNAQNDWVCTGGATGGPPGGILPGMPPPTPGPIINPFPPAGTTTPTVITGTPSGTPPDNTVTGDMPACSGNAGSAFDEFIEHLKLREGVRNCVYRDSRGFPTVGVGHLVRPEDGLNVGDCISDAQVDAFLQSDAQWAWDCANQNAAAAGVSDPCFIICLGSVNYQLGCGWKDNMRAYDQMVAGDFCGAANRIEGYAWNRQTPVRVDDFQACLRDQAAKAGRPCP